MKLLPLALVAVVAAAGTAGVLLERHYLSPHSGAQSATPSGDAGRRILYWWDPMMPAFKSDKPGKSPMGMDLIPVYEGDAPAAEEAGAVTVSPAILNNLGVRTAIVERTSLTPAIETFGTVAYDESRIAHVHVRARGWIERLHTRVEGEPVAAGQPLFEFFSPDILYAGYEYVRELQHGGNPEIARRKLIALGVAERQIEEMRRTRQAPERIQVFAPRAGVITSLGVAEGMYVDSGETLLSIVDYDRVWVIADVIESQGALVSPGLSAEVRIAGAPGRTWSGVVDYVYPRLRPETRTLRLRILVDNPDRTLKADMFASVRLAAPARDNVLAIPREALIRTGRGERVVLALGDGRFRPVAVEAGLAIGDKVEIREGLKEGDRVVASAHFLLDSESSLNAGLERLDAAAETDANAEIWTEATVNEVSDGIVNLSHEAIPALGWPAMTMDFALDPMVPPETLPVEARRRVRLAKSADGSYRVVAVEPAGGAQ